MYTLVVSDSNSSSLCLIVPSYDVRFKENLYTDYTYVNDVSLGEHQKKVALGCLCNQAQRKNIKPHNHPVGPSRIASFFHSYTNNTAKFNLEEK